MNASDMERLAGENAGLIRCTANRYRRLCEMDRAADFDDLIQAGTLGVWKAAQTFDPDAGKSWAGWAVWWMKSEINALIGLKGRQRADLNALSLDAPLLADETDGDTFGDTLPDTSLPDADAAILAEELRRTVRAAVDELPDFQRNVIRAHHLDGLSCAQIAEREGLTASQVSRADMKACENLRRSPSIAMLARAHGLDMETRFYAHKGVEAFRRDWTSTVEAAVLWRDSQRGSQREERRSKASP